MRRTLTSARPARRRLRAVAATALVGALLVGCGNEDDGATAEDPAADTGSSEGAPADEELPAWSPQIETDGEDVVALDFSAIEPAGDELLVHQVTTGDGPAVEAGQNITADYFGQLPDAEEPFDESFSGEPFTAPIGQQQLIAGWDQGLVGVPVGSRVVMAVPPDLGYGDAGAPPSIPGGSTLYFVIDIIDAQ